MCECHGSLIACSEWFHCHPALSARWRYELRGMFWFYTSITGYILPVRVCAMRRDPYLANINSALLARINSLSGRGSVARALSWICTVSDYTWRLIWWSTAVGVYIQRVLDTPLCARLHKPTTCMQSCSLIVHNRDSVHLWLSRISSRVYVCHCSTYFIVILYFAKWPSWSGLSPRTPRPSTTMTWICFSYLGGHLKSLGAC